MGRIRKYGYIIEWFIGDHHPKHVHVYDSKGKFIGRFVIETRTSLEGWKPNKKLLLLIQELIEEGKL